MTLELPDDQINELQRASIERLIEVLASAHYTDLVVESRINGENRRFQADWIKHLKIRV